ncbi:hypothetical protein HK19_11725 [Acetobacter persici]|uniref:hypothetical protein n=1 Tax=Acetobacter persici TaxID=1076596 RepID=UPI000A3BE601|nr:hypothetical protein [Acetobacter persici]OUI90119.1 hypothetical protein HK19_11725 [Acetobacter persici]
MSKPEFERSYVTELLVAALLDVQVGQIITYKELQALVNHDIQRKQRYFLEKAVTICRRKHKRDFTTLHNVGLQRTPAQDLAERGKGQIKRIRNAAKKGAEIMDTADRQELNQSQALEHDATRGIIAAIQTASKTRKNTQPQRGNPDPQVTL